MCLGKEIMIRFRGNFPPAPSPKWEISVNDGLEEGLEGSFPETFNEKEHGNLTTQVDKRSQKASKTTQG